MSTLLFTCSKNSLARDSCCHWPCIPSASLGLFRFHSFRREILPQSLYILVSSPTFSIACHDAPFSPRTHTTATSSRVPLLLLSDFCCNTADTNKLAVSDSAPSSTTTEANCQKLRALSLQRLSHQNIGFLLDADRAWHETYFFCFIPAQVQDITHIILRFFGFYPKHLLFWTSNLLTLFTQLIYLSTLFTSRHMTQRHTQTRTHTHHTHTHAHRMQEQHKRRNEDEREKRPL